MAVTEEDSGTQTATLTTEHELASINTTGVFILEVDTNEMTDTDVTILRAYHIPATGGTEQTREVVRLEGEQDPDGILVTCGPVSNYNTDADSVRFTLQQLVGTGRDYDWSVIKHA